MGFFGAAHTYPTMMKLGTIVPYPKKIQKIYESRDTTFEFCCHQHFIAGNQQIFLYQKISLLIHKDFFTPFDT